MSIIAPLYFTQWLLQNYGTDAMATYIVNHREIWFVPILNVDGYLYNEQIAPTGGGMWRKNLCDNDSNGIFEPSLDGVDLNRNYGYGWGYDNIGSSNNPISEIYRGDTSFSEPETQAIRQFCISRGFNTALNFHTFGDLCIYPQEPDGSIFPDQDVFRIYAHDITKANGYVFGNGMETVQYATNGDSDAWMYGEQGYKNKIFAFTPEIGTQFDYFWAPSERILELAEENLYPQIYMVMAAGAYLKVANYSYNDSIGGDGDMAAEAGETADLLVKIKNKGWNKSINQVTAVLLCIDTNITINLDTIITDFDTLQEQMLVFNITLNDSIFAGYSANMQLQFSDTAGYLLTEDFNILFGKPFIKFYDNAENGTALWTATGTWNTTTEKSSEGSQSFTDSPNDDYTANSETSLTLNTPIDLSGLNNAILTFKTRYNMERDWDLAQLQISTNNGSTWIPLQGEYTTKGAGDEGMQPLNSPVYNGNRNIDWVLEKSSLLPYLGQQVIFRFLIKTDVGVQTDGWYIDDIRLIAYTSQPLMPEILSVTTYQNTTFTGSFPVEAVVSDEQGNLEVELFYSINDSNFITIPMQMNDFFNYTSLIPAMPLGTSIAYYVKVTDTDNNCDSSEIKHFLVTNQPPVIAVNLNEITSRLAVGQTENHTLTISNNGLLPLNWNISAVSIQTDTKDSARVFTDPIGDQTGTSPDFTGMFAEILGDTAVYMQLQFAANINPATMLAINLCDIDQDNETGLTGEEIFGIPGWDIAGENLVIWDLANMYGNGAGVYVTNATFGNATALIPYTVSGQYMSAIIPLSYLGNDDGNMDVTAICGSPQGYDAAPNTGHGTIGIPGYAAWLKIGKSFGTTYEDDSTNIIITLKATTVPPAIYHAEITIESNDTANPEIIIPVTLTVPSNENKILSFSFPQQVAPATINNNTHRVNIKVAQGTSLTDLTATFSLSEGATATVGGVNQVSGITANNFSTPLTYQITAADSVHVQNWIVTVTVATAIEETTSSAIAIYPNPATDKIFISGPENANITIYSILGEKVMQLNQYNCQKAIDVSNLGSGMYIIKILVNEIPVIQKIKIEK